MVQVTQTKYGVGCEIDKSNFPPELLSDQRLEAADKLLYLALMSIAQSGEEARGPSRDIFKDKHLTPQQKLLYIILCLEHKQGNDHPSTEDMAKALGTHKVVVSRGITALKKRGWVTTERQSSGGRGCRDSMNKYILHGPK